MNEVHKRSLQVRNLVLDSKVYLVSKCLKQIETMLPSILKNKGCDASNIFDEEPARHEVEFSDDEAEKEFKRSKK